MSRTLSFFLALVVGGLAWAGIAAEKTHKLTTVSPRKMADSLHALIAADQHAYLEMVVRFSSATVPSVPAMSGQKMALPPHATLLRNAAQRIQQDGAEFSYTLRSLWPIQSRQGPQTQEEEIGLRHLTQHPNAPYYTEEELGGRSYFTAIYPNVATSTACIECHNRNPESPKRDFKLGDVLGGTVIRIPLEF